MSKLLIEEHPLQVLPTLAVRIGLNEAIILQQVHYWTEINRKAKNNLKDGYYWTFNSYEDWTSQFPFWSSRTIQRGIRTLEKLRLVVTGNYNRSGIDRTKWYRIDYEVVKALESYPFGQNGTINTTEWHNHLDKLALPLPETNTETNSKNDNKGVNPEDFPCVFIFFREYANHFGEQHPFIRKEQIEECEYTLRGFVDEYDIDTEAYIVLVQAYFNSNFTQGTDYNINHFANYSIMLNRFYEELY